jgi:predicted TIM-barrel fold metal-dependent hydrolase
MMGWTAEKSIADMDRAGIATAILSVTTPGIPGDQASARSLARACNEYAKQLTKDYPGRFGFFAALPMPDVEGSLREVEYALDTLGADGIGLLTSYDNKYLGDPSFAPLFDELDRRKAVVYTHPRAAKCCANILPDVNDSAIEFATDTSRTIASLVFSGTAARRRNMQLILSHAGGTMPFIIERFTRLPLMTKHLVDRVPDGVLHEIQRFHYDLAQASHPIALSAITQLVDVSQLLFGTDFPYRTGVDHVNGIKAFFDETSLRKIERENALALMPGLRAGQYSA